MMLLTLCNKLLHLVVRYEVVVFAMNLVWKRRPRAVGHARAVLVRKASDQTLNQPVLVGTNDNDRPSVYCSE
jgi:hypothetical protein